MVVLADLGSDGGPSRPRVRWSDVPDAAVCSLTPASPPRCSSTHSDSAIKALLDFSTSFRASGSFVGPRVRLRALQPRDKRSKCPARAPGQQGPHSHLPAPHCVLFISSHLLFMGDFLEMADACRIAHGWLRPVYVRRANQSCRLVVFQTVPEAPICHRGGPAFERPEYVSGRGERAADS